MYVSDSRNNRIRKVTISTGVITTIAGTGATGYSGDNGQATAAITYFPHGINLDSVGNVYFGDSYSYNVVRKITVATGIITTVAGIGGTSGGYNGDNMQATTALLNTPHDVVLDSYNNLYITDWSNSRIRKVDVSTGVITTVAGKGTASSTGDGGAATSATINSPAYGRFDSAGNYYFSEYYGHYIRKIVTVSTEIPTVTPSIAPTYYPSLSPHSVSVITTIAGTGSTGYSGDNSAASSATLNCPIGVAVDASGRQSYPLGFFISLFDIFSLLGNVYIGDQFNHRIRKVTISTGIITTIAGTGTSSFSGDGGAATSAALYQPDGIAIDSAGI